MWLKQFSGTLQDFEQAVEWLYTNLSEPHGETYENHSTNYSLYYVTSRWLVSFNNTNVGIWVDGRCLRGSKRVEFMLKYA